MNPVSHAVLTVAGLLADLADDGPPGTGPEFGKASPFGLLVILVLLAGVFLLVRSMNRQLKKVPTSFEQAEDAGEAGEPGDAEHADDAGDTGTG